MSEQGFFCFPTLKVEKTTKYLYSFWVDPQGLRYSDFPPLVGGPACAEPLARFSIGIIGIPFAYDKETFRLVFKNWSVKIIVRENEVC